MKNKTPFWELNVNHITMQKPPDVLRTEEMRQYFQNNKEQLKVKFLNK